MLLLSRSLSLKCLYCTLYLTRRVVNTLWWLRLQLIHEMVVFWGPSIYLSGSRHQWQELAESRIYKFSVDKYVQFTMTNYYWFMTWLCFEFLQCCHSWSTFGGPLLSKKPKARNQVMQKILDEGFQEYSKKLKFHNGFLRPELYRAKKCCWMGWIGVLSC